MRLNTPVRAKPRPKCKGLLVRTQRSLPNPLTRQLFRQEQRLAAKGRQLI